MAEHDVATVPLVSWELGSERPPTALRLCACLSRRRYILALGDLACVVLYVAVDSANENIIGFRPRVFKRSKLEKTAGEDCLVGSIERCYGDLEPVATRHRSSEK